MAEQVSTDKVIIDKAAKREKHRVIFPPNYFDFMYKQVNESHYTNDKLISNSQNRYRAFLKNSSRR